MTAAGIKCPISCGQCCDYWRDVPELVAAVIAGARECPHTSDAGCVLPREQRPEACQEYLCCTGGAVVAGSMTLAEGERRAINCEHGHSYPA